MDIKKFLGLEGLKEFKKQILKVVGDTTVTPEMLATALASYKTSEQVAADIKKAIDDLIGGAPQTYDTLKEIADYINDHKSVETALNSAIGTKLDKTVYEADKPTFLTKTEASGTYLTKTDAENTYLKSAEIDAIPVAEITAMFEE